MVSRSCQPTRLCHARRRERTGALDVEEVDVVGGGVHHGPERQCVRNLPVEPDVFVRGEQPGKFGPDDTDDVTQHGKQDASRKEGEGQASTTGHPDRPSQRIERGKLLVRFLCTCIER